MSDLKPCPFCGGEYDAQSDTVYHIGNCAFGYCASEDLELIPDDVWNTRTTVTEAQVLDELRKLKESWNGDVGKGALGVAILTIKQLFAEGK